MSGVSGVFGYVISPTGMRSANVITKAFGAGFQRMVHRFCPVPVGSSDRVTNYRHFRAACSVGKCPRTRNVVERNLNAAKQWRALATRYDRSLPSTAPQQSYERSHSG